jgi:hypothetical protein
MSVSHFCFQKLDFTESEGPCSSEALSKKELSAEELSQRLEKLIMEEKADDERIFDWVEVQTRAVLCGLCRVAIGSSEFTLPVLHTYYPSCTRGLCACMYVVSLKFKDRFYNCSVVFTLSIFVVRFLRQGLIMCLDFTK